MCPASTPTYANALLGHRHGSDHTSGSLKAGLDHSKSWGSQFGWRYSGDNSAAEKTPLVQLCPCPAAPWIQVFQVVTALQNNVEGACFTEQTMPVN